jgi:hypothetical protein
MINTNFSQSKIAVNTELMDHLKNVNSNSLVGLCIKQILLREEELRKLLNELKTISEENPGIMMSVLGKEAYSLLMGKCPLSSDASFDFSP